MRAMVLPLLLAGVALEVPLAAQTPPEQVSQHDLTEFEGHYEYRDGLTLYMVSDGQRLYAIIGEAKYLLRDAGTDTFLNPLGDTIPFVRDESGRLAAFEEYGVRFARLSSDVPDSASQLLKARPDGSDGTPLGYSYTPPAQLADGIGVANAADTGFPVTLAERLVNGIIDGTYPDVHSLLIYHRGSLVLEEYFYGFDRDSPHEMRSFSKSVISLLSGAAVDRDLLSADEPALDSLGYSGFANPDPRKAKVTLKQLLSNQSGLACDEHDSDSPGHEVKLYETADWVKAFVDLPMIADPGTAGRYCSAGFYTAGRLVERAAGRPLADFADDALFGPLGIRRADWNWDFTLDRSQRNDFAQIHLRPRDMLKLGMLIRDRGKWNGRQVISGDWIDAAVSKQSRVDDSDYGLGIWHRWYGLSTATGQRRVDTILLTGNGGQKVQIVP